MDVHRKYRKYRRKCNDIQRSGANLDNNKWYNDFIQRKRNMPSKKYYISIEANIGTGKSTLLNAFKYYNNDLLILLEPIQLWGPWLGKFYSGFDKQIYPDKNPYITAFQLKVLKSYYDILKSPENQLSHGLITERSPSTALEIFSQNSLDNDELDHDEYNLIKEYFDVLFKEDDLPDISIYLSVSSETVSLERIKKRARKEEKDIPTDLIRQLHYKHENFYKNDSTSTIIEVKPNMWTKRRFNKSNKIVYVVNADGSKMKIVNIAKKIMENIYGTNFDELD